MHLGIPPCRNPTAVSHTLLHPADGASERVPLTRQDRIPSVRVVRGPYEMRFAKTHGERDQALRLRHQVFQEELGEGVVSIEGIDRDPFDDPCQHLVVLDRQSGETVGTYRMQTWECAQEGLGFYTQQEFDLTLLGDEFMMQTVELGRACVAERHRNKVVLLLLWQGLTAYMKHHGKTGFCGCSSLTSQDMAEGLRLYDQLAQDGSIHAYLKTIPHPEWRCDVPDASGPVVKVPRLFRAYLRQGAKILSPPAIDREFGTIDFLTYVWMSDELKRRYALPNE